MKAVIQRVASASVKVDNEIIGEIKTGMLILLGVKVGDSEIEANKLAGKVSKLRIFEDDGGKMNLSLQDIGGEILCISQFTLLADTKKGNRPSFINAEKGVRANELYENFCTQLVDKGFLVEKGKFGADMKVELLNDGPVTVILDTD